jgi:hypothetical protein
MIMSDQKNFKISVYLIIGIIALLAGIVSFIGPGFFTPNTYYNWGDTCFPLDPLKNLQITYSSWSPIPVMGLNNVIVATSLFTSLVYALWLIKIPLWIINRLWFVIPTALLGYFTFYLYESIMGKRKLLAGGIISVLFIIFIPNLLGNPNLVLSLAAFPFFFGSLIRGLTYPRKQLRYALYIGLSMAMLMLSPRFLFMCSFMFLCWLPLYLIFYGRGSVRTSLRFLVMIGVITVLLNAFWIIPFSFYYTHTKDFVAQSMENCPELFTQRVQLLFNYKGCGALHWIMRLLVSLPIVNIYPYFNIPLISFITYFIPVYVYFSVLLVRKKHVFLMGCLALISTFLATTIKYPLIAQLYLFLYNHFPGFVIMNNPLYWTYCIAIFYAVLFGVTSQVLMERLHSQRSRIVFIGVILIIILFVYGEPVTIGKIPPQENVWGTNAYPNHQPPMRVPDAYFTLKDFLSQHSNEGYRILNLPWNHEGYVAYSWWHAYSTPELLNFISPLEVLGTFRFPERGLQQDILISLNEGEMPTAIDLLSDMNVKYILVHKDYYAINRVFYPRPDAQVYLDKFNNNQLLKRIMANDFFVLYEITKDVLPVVYAKDIPGSFSSAKKPMIIFPLRFHEPTHVLINHSLSLEFKDSFSIAAWIYPLGQPHMQCILSKGSLTAEKDSWLYLSLDGQGDLRVALNTDAGPVGVQTGGIKYNAWNFVSVSFDMANRYIALVVNQGEERKISFPDGFTLTGSPWIVGGVDNNGLELFFNGYIYSLQMYDYALNAKQRVGLLKKGLSEVFPGEGVRGWWFFKNSYEGYVYDSSGNNNRGYLKGPVEWEGVAINKDLIYEVKSGGERRLNFKKTFLTHYVVDTINQEPFVLRLNERFSPWWECFVNGRLIEKHTRTPLGTNEWHIQQQGLLHIELRYKVQRFVIIGTCVSILSFAVLLALLLFSKKNAKK